MMQNIGGPGPIKRRITSITFTRGVTTGRYARSSELCCSTSKLPLRPEPKPETSVILYACPIWSEALSVGTTKRILFPAYRLSALRRISGFKTVSDKAVLVLAKTIPIDRLADKIKSSRVPGTNSNYKSGGTFDFHAQMAEKFKGKVDISPCSGYNPLDEERTLRTDLLHNPVTNWSWLIQKVPAQIW